MQLMGMLVCVLFGLAGTAYAQAPKPQSGEKYALLVGVRQYDPTELRSLPYAEPDVEELGALFRDAGYRRVVIMTIAEGTKRPRLLPLAANIRKELAGLLEDCEPADTALVVFAGHGVQFRGEDVNYFCPMDARLADRTTLISLNEVYRDLEECNAGTRLMLVDACRNDPQSDNSRSRATVRLESVTRPQQDRPPGGIAALFSCSEGQKAYEHDALKHGVFFHFVIRGLEGEADYDGDGVIELEELALYSRKRVPAFVKDEYGPEVRQVPVLRGEVGGLAALVGPRKAKEPDGTTSRAGKSGEARTELVSLSSERPPARPSTPEAPGEITSSTGMRLVMIRAGEFLMGSPDSDQDADADERPRHTVRITRPFYLGATEVTVGQFRRVAESAGLRTQAERDGKGGWGWNQQTNSFRRDPKYTWRSPGFTQGDDHPVVNVSWNDAIAFCNALSELDGLKPYYQFGAGAQSGGEGYRLATEAEWEYACRAGTTTRYQVGDDPETLALVGNVADSTAKEKYPEWHRAIAARDEFVHTAPVGRFSANAFGLYDMHGNVWEWCGDCYRADYYAGSTDADPTGPLQATHRVNRGGAWYYDPRNTRSADRSGNSPDSAGSELGFRVARDRSSR